MEKSVTHLDKPSHTRILLDWSTICSFPFYQFNIYQKGNIFQWECFLCQHSIERHVLTEKFGITHCFQNIWQVFVHEIKIIFTIFFIIFIIITRIFWVCLFCFSLTLDLMAWCVPCKASSDILCLCSNQIQLTLLHWVVLEHMGKL